MGDNLQKLFKIIDRFLDLSNSDISRVRELGEKICQGARELQDAVKLDLRAHERFKQLISKLENTSARLSRSIINSKRGMFQQDWVRFARAESIKLKDEVLALREFLTFNMETIERLLKETQEVPITRLLEILREEHAIHEITYAKLVEHLNKFSRRTLRKQEREASKHLTRISCWLSNLREIRQVRMSVAKAKR